MLKINSGHEYDWPCVDATLYVRKFGSIHVLGQLYLTPFNFKPSMAVISVDPITGERYRHQPIIKLSIRCWYQQDDCYPQ